jgi:hypothetical protein
MQIWRTLLLPSIWLGPFLLSSTSFAFTSPMIAGRWANNNSNRGQPQPEQAPEGGPTRLTMANKNPTTFREAEVLGLKLMQEQKYAEALVGTY